ncbi:MAG TPA: 30S ribosomal protein S12 methylthiotransferase RimO [Acidimicrobiia bacterium]|nr:30S ribosomal protein S12 methylthiotransferase RimO [Acidimicrobiia bacterium]HZQ77213.1 30S ribosomal protein S12 methylthiotransferase RimO [Acidimicrobiia bacterium]
MAPSGSAQGDSSRSGERYWIETLGCPKNAVDSDKVAASLLSDGLRPARSAAEADLVVVNTCAFVEAARQESIDTVLALSDARKGGARLVVTGCLAERYGDELAAALPEADAVVGFASEGSIAEVVLRRPPKGGPRDLLELPRPAPAAPWAYVKVAEGCDRTCAFCAIPSFRGKQRSRAPESIVAEARSLVEGGAREIVLVAQDLASYGRDAGAPGALAPLLRSLDGLSSEGLARLRLLYLYPSQVREPLVGTMLDLATPVPYFDLSLQHASETLLRSMRRWGSGERFLEMIDGIREREPAAAFRSSFIVGFPGETEADHEELLAFLDAAGLDWAGLFPFSAEEGTSAAAMGGAVDDAVVKERLDELSLVQDRITQAGRDALVGSTVEVLVDGYEDGVAIGRTHREAPEIDGVVRLEGAGRPAPGSIVTAEVVSAVGPDLVALAG